MERNITQQYAKMFGFDLNSDSDPSAYGHIYSSGFLANQEALYNLYSGRFLGFTLAQAVKSLQNQQHKVKNVLDDLKTLPQLNDWELFNLPMGKTIRLSQQFIENVDDVLQQEERTRLIDSFSPKNLGQDGFFQKYWTVKPPILLVPVTISVFLKQIAQLLGLTPEQIIELPVDKDMHIKIESLERILHQALSRQTPILAVVAVLGSENFGTVDPIHKVVQVREKYSKKGLYFPIHVEACCGGHLASLFRTPKGEFISQKDMVLEFNNFPDDETYHAYSALKDVDTLTFQLRSYTGDSKEPDCSASNLGVVIYKKPVFTKYSANKFSVDNAFNLSFVKEEKKDIIQKTNKSRVVSKKVLSEIEKSLTLYPLHKDGLGQLIKRSINNSEYFFEQVIALQHKVKNLIHINMPVKQNTNVICLVASPSQNKNVVVTNQFSETVFLKLKAVLQKEKNNNLFFLENTHLSRKDLSTAEASRLALVLGFDKENFVEQVRNKNEQANHLFILKYSFFNNSSLIKEDSRNYLEQHLMVLENILIDSLPGTGN